MRIRLQRNDSPHAVKPWTSDEWSVLREISRGLLSGLCVLRGSGVLHCDIKPENCLLARPSPADLARDALSKETTRSLSELAGRNDWRVLLGDFGSALHSSELHQTFDTFDVQSLPYRAPEVLCGVPFSYGIDMWSLGVTLLELCLGRPLFTASSREDLVADIARHIGPLSRVRFSGGMYSDVLSACGEQPQPTLDYSQRLAAIRKLLLSSGRFSELLPGEALHFFAALLSVDPDLRISPIEALQHPFMCANGAPSVPASLAVGGGRRIPNRHESVKALRTCAQNELPSVQSRNSEQDVGNVRTAHADSFRSVPVRRFGDFSSIPVLTTCEKKLDSEDQAMEVKRTNLEQRLDTAQEKLVAGSVDWNGARIENAESKPCTTHPCSSNNNRNSSNKKARIVVELENCDTEIRIQSNPATVKTKRAPPNPQQRGTSTPSKQLYSRATSRVNDCLPSPFALALSSAAVDRSKISKKGV